MLKHMPEKAIKTFQNALLYSKKAVGLKEDNDRRQNNNNELKKRSDNNISDRITEFVGEFNRKKSLQNTSSISCRFKLIGRENYCLQGTLYFLLSN